MKLAHTLVPACLLAFAGCEPGGEPDDDRIVKAGEYEVTAPELLLHASIDGEPLGRLYRGEVMDVHEVTPDGWAFGFAAGDVQACVWARYLDVVPQATIFNFEEDAEPGPHAELCQGEEPDAEPRGTDAFASQVSDDEAGTPVRTDCDYSHYWKNWDWSNGAGLGPADGKLDRDTEVHWRYVTIDGNGVMARIDGDNWVFVARPCVPLEL